MVDTDELKGMFIIEKEEYEKSKIEEHIKKISKFCKTDSSGKVHTEVKGLKNKEKIKIVLVARFLANKLEPKIDYNVSIEDVATSLGIGEHQSRARLSDLAKENFASSSERGLYSVIPHKIDEFLNFLEVKIKK